ncbi:MAG TPA: hypothetical protein VHY35_17635 [Stellaceae bacterium]|jgi:hypothetical protein|nr:hypothetical protein [Stellaceae bacterium]
MNWMLTAVSAAVAAMLALPSFAAQSAVQAPQAAATSKAANSEVPDGEDKISFEQYRDWRLNFIEQRRSELAVQLSGTDLPAQQKTRLQQVKAYYEWFAGLPDADRDRRFRERFDRIDANHDGIIDHSERTAWHDRQRAFYHHASNSRDAPAAAK